MNQKLSSRVISRCLWMGALLCSVAVASADTQVTFQVDMSNATASGFTLGNSVYARGTFDGWSTPGSLLTNNAGASNPYLYSGTFDDTDDANGNVMDWQFTYTTSTSTNYTSQADGDNYAFLLPSTSGASAVTPTVFWDDDGTPVDNNVTFQVDMAEQINIGTFDPVNDSVFLQGNYTGWGDNVQLTNDPSIIVTNAGGVLTSNVYTGVALFTLSSNAPSEYKFVFNNGSDHYENPAKGDPDNSGNRFFYNSPVNGAQTLPIVFFGDVPFALISYTNKVVFQEDMSAIAGAGGFDTNSQTLNIAGNFNGWNTTIDQMTNNPNSSNPNLYIFVYTNVANANYQLDYKYVIQPGNNYEQPQIPNGVTPIGGNRFLNLPNSNGSFTLTTAWNDFQSVHDYATVPTTITLNVDMAGAVGTDSHAFDTNNDSVYVNGIPAFAKWDAGDLASYQMTQVPGTTIWTISIPVSPGTPLLLDYRYGINAIDDEAPGGVNHFRYIRSLNNYTLPTDRFGDMLAEPSFGDLTVSKTGAQASVSWLGRPGVALQTTSVLGSSWTTQSQTDGTNLLVAQGSGIASTNYPIGAGSLFFELIKKQ